MEHEELFFHEGQLASGRDGSPERLEITYKIFVHISI